MEINEHQAREYIRDLMSLRNERLGQLRPDEDTLGGMIADAMNRLEEIYVVYRSLLDNTPQWADDETHI